MAAVITTYNLVTGIAALAAALIAAWAGVAVARSSAKQLDLVHQSATLTALQPFYDRYHRPPMREIRRRVYDTAFDPSSLSPDDLAQLEELVNSLEYLGALVNNGIISFDVVKSIFHTSVPGLYPQLKPYIDQQRQLGPKRVRYALNYENLVKRYSANQPTRFWRRRSTAIGA